MSKFYFLTFSDDAIDENGVFSEELQQKIANESIEIEGQTYAVCILDKDTFTGESGNTYGVQEVGERNSELGLFKNSSSINGCTIKNSLGASSPNRPKRFNNMGIADGNLVNTIEANLAGAGVFRVGNDTEYIEENAFKNFEMIEIQDPENITSDITKCGAQYINPIFEIFGSYSYNGYVFKDQVYVPAMYSRTLYGIYDFETVVTEGVLDLSSIQFNKGDETVGGIENLYSFDGELKSIFDSDSHNVSKIILNDDIQSITVSVANSNNLTITYDNVDYTSAGTGNNDTFADLNAKLVTDGVCAEGFDFVTITE